MQIPLQITFRHMDPSPAVESRIRKEASKLELYHEHVMSCRVVLEAPHRHHHKGKLYHLSIDLKAPGKELAVTRKHHEQHAHEDIYVAIRDAFDAMKRQLANYARRQRGDVKSHEEPAFGRVSELFPAENYGRIQTPDGRHIYFHRNSVLNSGYEKLATGSEVRFVEEAGEQGPQASTVTVVGKHHGAI